MNVGIEALFTSALGLQPPWVVEDVKLDTAKRRIDFEVGCRGAMFACPQCGVGHQRWVSSQLSRELKIKPPFDRGRCFG